MKKLLIIISCILIAFGLCACENSSNKNQNEKTSLTNTNKVSGEEIIEEIDKSGDNIVVLGDDNGMSKFGDVNRYKEVKDNPIVTIEMEDGEKIVVELYPQIAPNSVENFISLVKEGFYDGTIFHRVIPGFMAQGGDPNGKGTGGPGYTIVGEFKENGFDNSLSHDVGVISMARSSNPDSAGSQFFIVTDENAKESLDNKYAPFGKVIEGMDEVMKIVNAKCEYTTAQAQEAYIKMMANQKATELEQKLVFTLMGYDTGITIDKPIEEQKMKKVTVDTKGVAYQEPSKIK